MNYFNLLILQFIAHLLADFIFQSEKSVNEKNKYGLKSKTLLYHSLTVFSLAYFFSFQWNFLIAALIIALFHYLIDGAKSILVRRKMLTDSIFFIDQSFHFLIIFTVVILFCWFYQFKPFLYYSFNSKILLIAAAYLFCGKPANIFIKEIFKTYKIIPKEGIEEIPNAGKLIGNLERFLVLTLVLNSQFEAVGFIIAAKSILRFKESEGAKAEYVLVGTLLSFGIAVVIGILILFYK
jgi:hypothetical protein